MVSPAFRSFDQVIKIKGDTASKGSHAEYELYARAVWIETQQVAGRVLISFLWDLEAFYDSIDAAQLWKDLLSQGSPICESTMALVCHGAP